MDDDDLGFADEAPAVEQLLIQIGRELRDTNRHLGALRVYSGIVVVGMIMIIVLFALWLTGVITVDVNVAL